MGSEDLRQYLKRIEAAGKLKRISKEVDGDWELSGISRSVWKRFSDRHRFALLFENVKGHHGQRVVVGAFGQSRDLYAMALNVTPDRIHERWSQALSSPLMPVMVGSGPVKENIFKNDDVDLFQLPMSKWHPFNKAPYITAGSAVTKDPDSGWCNVGTYASMLVNKNLLTLRGGFYQHMALHYEKYEQRDQEMPIAVVVGPPPVVGMASVAEVPYGVEEYAVAGGLQGEPIKLVKCETIDLEVPADAEIVIEGVVPPHVRESDGPHVDHCGFQLPVRQMRRFEVRCITHRNQPIYQEYDEGLPPNESTIIRGIGLEAILWHKLGRGLGLTGIRGIRATEGSAGWGTWIVAIDKFTDADPARVAAGLLAGSWCGKRVIVVDSDIDIYDDTEIEWALAFCVRWDRDMFLFPRLGYHPLDPSIASHEQHIGGVATQAIGSRIDWPPAIVIDATKKSWFPKVGKYPQETYRAVEERWKDYGLPPLDK